MSISTDGYKIKAYCLQVHYLCTSRFMPSANYYSNTFINSIVSKVESDVAKHYIPSILLVYNYYINLKFIIFSYWLKTQSCPVASGNCFCPKSAPPPI